MVGATIGQYRVTGTIGQGGMGVVYAAEHVLLGRPAAIKVLLPALSQRQDMVQRFFNEAKAATAIRHPGIVEIYDFGWSAEGAAFIVMEHLQGEPLARRMARGRQGWRAAMMIMRQIAGALSAAHAKGIVHRDLKPDNVFVVPDPEVAGGERIKLLDFGIAKLAGDGAPGMHMTRTGAVMGTPIYMSPEQCRGVAVDHRADLYALGCIAFELCCGRPPFLGEGSGDVMAAHIHVPVPAMSGLAADVPAEVEQLIRKLLVKPPADRVQRAEDVIRAIDAIAIDGAAAMVRASSAMSMLVTAPSLTTLSGAAMAGPGTAPTRAGVTRTKLIAGVAAAIVAVAALAIVAVVKRGASAPPAADSQAPVAVAPAPTAPPSTSAATSAPVVQPGAATLAPAPGVPTPSVPASRVVAPVPATSAATVGVAVIEPTPAIPPSPHETIDVTLDSLPVGASVVLDGAVIGKTPYRGAVPRTTGDITLVLKLTGYVDKRVVAPGSEPIHDTVKLARRASARPAPEDKNAGVNPF